MNRQIYKIVTLFNRNWVGPSAAFRMINRRNYMAIPLILFLSVSLWVQCGVYGFKSSTLPPHIKTVGVPLFEDRTAEFGIDQQVTDLLIDAIVQDNTLKIADPASADALIKGVITNIRDGAGSYSEDEIASDFRVTLSIKVTFEDVRLRNVMWEQTFSDFGEYTDNREEGIEEAVQKIAEDVINQAVSNW